MRIEKPLGIVETDNWSRKNGFHALKLRARYGMSELFGLEEGILGNKLLQKQTIDCTAAPGQGQIRKFGPQLKNQLGISIKYTATSDRKDNGRVKIFRCFWEIGSY